jgi:hypothetical protein
MLPLAVALRLCIRVHTYCPGIIRAGISGLPINVLRGRVTPMLFCLTAEYTPQALNAMRENPKS